MIHAEYTLNEVLFLSLHWHHQERVLLRPIHTQQKRWRKQKLIEVYRLSRSFSTFALNVSLWAY